MFFIGGGKKGLPWGQLRSHRDIARAKSDAALDRFCSDLQHTEYRPISDALLKHMRICRERSQPCDDEEQLVISLLNIWKEVISSLNMYESESYQWQ